MTINPNYEVSSEGCVRHWEIPYASLTHNTPEATHVAQVVGTVGLQMAGTVLTIDAGLSVAIVDFTPGMVYRHNVRTVLTYNPGVAENGWTTVDIGDVVYYDGSASMPVDTFLSLSPLNTGGTANSVFGWVVPADENDTFPKAAGVSGNTWECAVMQHGA